MLNMKKNSAKTYITKDFQVNNITPLLYDKDKTVTSDFEIA